MLMNNPVSKSSSNPWKILLRNQQFRWLFGGNMALFFGFSATILLRSLLAWQLTHDEMALALINMVAAACMVSMSIFSGAVVDRFERRKLMFFCQWIILAAETTVLVLLALDYLQFKMLMISAIAASSTFPFIMPARTAMVVATVGRTSFGKANALMTGGMNVARMVSPALVGIIAEMAGVVYGYVFLVALHLCSQLCTWKLEANHPVEDSNRGAFFGEIKEGFVYISRHRPLAMCILFGLIPTLVVIPLQNLMVVFVDQIWGRGGSGLGIMMAATGVGGLLGSLLVAFHKEGSLVKPMVVAALVLGCCLAVLCHASWFWLAVMIILGIYSASVFTQTLMATGVQLMAEERLRGRITTMTMMSFGLAPLGTPPLAYAAQQIGPAWAMSGAAFLLIAAVLAMWFLSPSFRRIDEAARIHRD